MILPLVLLTRWKASLFSAVVAAFLIESYKTLSPDTGSQTVVLLGQISQQLGEFKNGSFPKPSAGQPFHPSKSVICINSMWLMSLVLSITSALLSTLAQGWADNYDRLPRLARSPHQRACIRSLLSLGLSKYKVILAIVITPTLLHISVFLFFIGLVILFATIHKTLAIISLIAVAFFGLAYFAVTILPCIDPSSPYATSSTTILCFSISAFLSIPAICLRFAKKRLSAGLASRGGIRYKVLRRLNIWYPAIEARRSIYSFPARNLLQRARNPTIDMDRRALTRLFGMISLSERKILKFVASIPKNKIVKLMTPPFKSGDIVFREPLLTVLRCYAYDTPVDQQDEGVRKRSLLVSLHAVHHIAKSFIVPYGSPVHNATSNYFLGTVENFAEIGLMQVLWGDQDPAVRVTSRSICALFARRLMREFLLSGSNWLHHVIGGPLEVILRSHDNIPALDRMNRISFVFGVLKYPAHLPEEQVTCFKQTLAILMDAGFDSERSFDRAIFHRDLSTLLEAIKQDGREGHDKVAGRLRLMFRNFLPAAAAPYEPDPRLDLSPGQELDLRPDL